MAPSDRLQCTINSSCRLSALVDDRRIHLCTDNPSSTAVAADCTTARQEHDRRTVSRSACRNRYRQFAFLRTRSAAARRPSSRKCWLAGEEPRVKGISGPVALPLPLLDDASSAHAPGAGGWPRKHGRGGEAGPCKRRGRTRFAGPHGPGGTSRASRQAGDCHARLNLCPGRHACPRDWLMLDIVIDTEGGCFQKAAARTSVVPVARRRVGATNSIKVRNRAGW